MTDSSRFQVEVESNQSGGYRIILIANGHVSLLNPEEARELGELLSGATAEAETRSGRPRAAKFNLFKDEANEYRFNLSVRSIGNEYEIIAASEGYPRKENAQKGIASVKRHAPGAEIDDETDEP